MAHDTFDYHVPTVAQAAEIDRMRVFAKAFRDAIEAMPAGRERSLALTNLEQALMWANKAVLVST